MENKHRSHETRDLERENRRQQRQKKWDERARSFWRAFLFTEDGKPKSGFLVYTFSLSIVFIALLLIGFHYIVDWLSPLTESWPVALGNLFASLCVSAAVLLVGYVLHRLLSDKRLMLGTYLWLLLYLVASVITMALLLREWETMRVFLHFVLWFAAIPVGLGLVLFTLLYRRDHHAPAPVEEEPAWKKYVRRS